MSISRRSQASRTRSSMLRLADAGGDADDQPVLAAVLQAVQRLVEHVQPAAALVADDLACLRC